MPDEKFELLLNPWSDDDNTKPLKLIIEPSATGLFIDFFTPDNAVAIAHLKIEIDKGVPRVLAYISDEQSEQPLLSAHISAEKITVELPSKPLDPPFDVKP